MEFNRLSAVFYQDYGTAYPEILNKPTRPYYVVLVKVMQLTFAIPLRSSIKHSFSFIADGNEAGLDFTKAVVIVDRQKYVEMIPASIRQHEFNELKKFEFEIETRFEKFLYDYIKKVKRSRENPRIPPARLLQFSCLQYFHKELGL
ncbi:MAG: hypothetical protein JEY71_16310 [Sphaerochaeta sp.]|nr:hypothetical protein [Sphaerochaeta sp.]